MGEIIVVTSGKGGVGKTTTTANIGAGLSRLGKKVLVIDTDLGLRNLDVVMGLENRIVYNLVDVIEGGCRLKQAMISDKRHENLYLLPSAQTKDKSAITPATSPMICLPCTACFALPITITPIIDIAITEMTRPNFTSFK